MLQQIIHYSFHLWVPGIIAWVFFRKNWKKAWLIMIATMLVDLDHLLADPIFSADRCSINFHPLHSYIAIGVYGGLLFIKEMRFIAAGLLLHMLADFLDCHWVG